MSPRQSAMYWAEWARVRDMLRTRGCTVAQVEEYRHALTRRALGVLKSSKSFTNADLDRVLARLKAESDPANLDAQLSIQDSPDRRRAYLLHRLSECCAELYTVGCDERLREPAAREGYVQGTALKVCKCELQDCTDAELGKVLGCLEARLRRLVAKLPPREPAENPF